MPGRGKYTVYARKTDKTVFLNQLFQKDPNYTGSEYNHLDSEEARKKIVEIGNRNLRPAVQTGDMQMFPNGVDMTYAGTKSDTKPPGREFKPDANGDPMNAFVPDTSSPGVGKTDGVQKEVARNPALTPDELATTLGKTYARGAGTRMPADNTQLVYNKNVLGDENRFDTKSVEQYPETGA